VGDVVDENNGREDIEKNAAAACESYCTAHSTVLHTPTRRKAFAFVGTPQPGGGWLCRVPLLLPCSSLARELATVADLLLLPPKESRRTLSRSLGRPRKGGSLILPLAQFFSRHTLPHQPLIAI